MLIGCKKLSFSYNLMTSSFSHARPFYVSGRHGSSELFCCEREVQAIGEPGGAKSCRLPSDFPDFVFFY